MKWNQNDDDFQDALGSSTHGVPEASPNSKLWFPSDLSMMIMKIKIVVILTLRSRLFLITFDLVDYWLEVVVLLCELGFSIKKMNDFILVGMF